MRSTILALDSQRLVCNFGVTHVLLQLPLDHFKTRRFLQMHIKPLLASEMVVCPAVMVACVGFRALGLHRAYDVTYDITYDIIA